MRAPHHLVSIVLLCLATAAPSTVLGVDYNWTEGSGVDANWLTPANWNPAGPPSGGGGNFARFFAGTPDAAQITGDVPAFQDFLTGNDGSPGVREVDQSAGTVDASAGWVRMGGLGGSGDVGTYNISGGLLQTGAFRIAEQGPQTATIIASGGELRQNDVADPGNTDSWNYIGQGGVATVNLSGTGLINTDSRTIFNAGSTITQTGGTLQTRRGEILIGDGGSTVTYNISAGTLQTLSQINNEDQGGNITVGQWDNSNGQLNVSNTAIVSASRNINIADGQGNVPSGGTITQTGGNVSFAGINNVEVTAGVFELQTYGRLRMSEPQAGTSTYNLSAGILRQNDVTNIGDGNNWNAIGGNGIANFNLSGTGVVSFDARTFVGRNSDAAHVSTVTQTGGLFEVRRADLTLGDGNGHGTYNISGGTLQTLGNSPIAVGQWDNSVGLLNVSGTGQVITGGDLAIGAGRAFADDPTNTVPGNSNGVVTQTGGTVSIGGNLRLTDNINNSATYNLQGGVLDLTGGNINHGGGTFEFNFSAGILRNAAAVNLNLEQMGGILEVGNTAGAGAITAIGGNYSLASLGTLTLELSLVSDQLAVNGDVTLSGTLDLVPIGLSEGDLFTIVANNGANPVSGQFAGRPDGSIFFEDGFNFQIDYQGADGNDVTLLVVPEPGSAIVLLLGVAVIGFRRRRAE